MHYPPLQALFEARVRAAERQALAAVQAARRAQATAQAHAVEWARARAEAEAHAATLRRPARPKLAKQHKKPR